MLIENLKDYDLVELVKDDEMARLMAKCVVSWNFVLSFNIVVFGISCYVFLLSSSIYIYIWKLCDYKVYVFSLQDMDTIIIVFSRICQIGIVSKLGNGFLKFSTLSTFCPWNF